MNEPFDDLLNAAQAAEYLAKKWDLDSWGVNAFRQYRYRLRKKGIVQSAPFLETSNTTLWRRSDLDTLPRPESSKSRNERHVPRLYTPKEVADMFGISVHALKNRRQRGQIEGIVIDERTVLYTKKQIEEADFSPQKRGPKPKRTI